MFEVIKEEVEENKYPLIAKAKCDGMKVLFFTCSSGVVIEDSDNFHKAGYTHTGWTEAFDSSHWEILHTNVRIELHVKEQA